MATKNSPYRTPVLVPHLRSKIETSKKSYPYSAPSNIVNICPRQFYYAQRVDKTYVRRLQDVLNFSLGFWAEDFLEKVLQQAGVQIIQREIEIEPDPEDLHGFTSLKARVDYLIKFNGNYYIGEVKKMNPRRFNNFRIRGLMTEQAAHFQILYYLYNWNKAIKQGADLPVIPKGIIIGISVEPVDILDTSVEYSEEDYRSFENKLNLIQALIENPKDSEEFGPPGRPEGYNYTHYVCRSCSFYDVCYTNKGLAINGKNYPELITEDERRMLNDVMINFEMASRYGKDAAILSSSARESLLGFMQRKEVVSLSFKSTVGELLAELDWHDRVDFNSELVREKEPDLYKEAEKVSKILEIDKQVKLSPMMSAMVSGRVSKINKNGEITYRNKYKDKEENEEDEIISSESD